MVFYRQNFIGKRVSQRSKHNDPYDYLLPSDDGAAAAVEKSLTA